MKAKQNIKLDAIISEADLAAFCPDLSTWADSWCCEDRDIIPGGQLVTLFKPFLIHLLGEGLTRPTRNRHRDNLWLLGGEIIRDIIETPKLRKRPVEELLRDVIVDGEGPLIHSGTSEAEQNSFDSTCRKLHRFLTAS